jgi:hypothetical protein
MAKRKITVTVDEELVDLAHALGDDASLSGVVNDALGGHVERLGRLAALRELLDGWDAAHGPTSTQAEEAARAVFDELDALAAPRHTA